MQVGRHYFFRQTSQNRLKYLTAKKLCLSDGRSEILYTNSLWCCQQSSFMNILLYYNTSSWTLIYYTLADVTHNCRLPVLSRHLSTYNNYSTHTQQCRQPNKTTCTCAAVNSAIAESLVTSCHNDVHVVL